MKKEIRSQDNPFEYDTPLTKFEVAKIIFFSVTLLLPLRFLFLVLLLVASLIISFIATLGLPRTPPDVDQKPMARWRQVLLSVLPFIARLFLFGFGFWRIKIIGKMDRKASLIIPNHLSFYDMFIVFWLSGGCTAVGKEEIFNIPFFGFLFQALQVIPLKRESVESREKTKNIMQKYIDSHKNKDESQRLPRIMIFPEGTTHRNEFILMFQQGSFVYGAPVQPIALDFRPYKHYNPCWLTSRSKDWYQLRCFCQFYMNLTVTILPVHYPSAFEVKDPVLFANNVRKEIAQTLNARVSGHWYEDMKLYSEAIKFAEKLDQEKIHRETREYMAKKEQNDRLRLEKLRQIVDLSGSNTDAVLKRKHEFQGKVFYMRRLFAFIFESTPKPAGNVDLSSFEMQEIKKIYGDKKSHLSEIVFLLRKFVEFDGDGNGVINYKDFCSILGIEETNPQSKNLFNFFDRNQNAELDFKEVAIGLAFCSSEINNEQKRRLAFDLFDYDGDGLIQWSQFEKLFALGEDQFTDSDSRLDLDKLRERAIQFMKEGGKFDPDAGSDFKITWDVFDRLSQEKPSIINIVLSKNNTGWMWNIEKNMEQNDSKKNK